MCIRKQKSIFVILAEKWTERQKNCPERSHQHGGNREVDRDSDQICTRNQLKEMFFMHHQPTKNFVNLLRLL